MRIITRGDISAAFRAAGSQIEPVFGDEAYAIPAYRYVWRDFSPDWKTFMRMAGSAGYLPEANDCDDYARLCASVAQICHARTPRERSEPECALAFGEFWFKSTVGPHAINVFCYASGGQIALGFYEPQLAKIVKHSTTQISSCYYARF